MDQPPDPTPWPGLELGPPVDGGTRSRVWRGRLVEGAGGRAGSERAVAVRRSRRSGPSLAWELDLLTRLDAAGFLVPTPIPAADGRPHVDGVVVQRWIDGHPPTSDADWERVATELRRLHRAAIDVGQRPDCCAVTDLARHRRSVDADLDRVPATVERRVVEVFASLADRSPVLIHGDPGPENLRIGDDGRVGLLDWDESRLDLDWHDLSNLGIAVLDPADQARAERLSHAWEAVNGWVVEPDYARRRLAALDELDRPSVPDRPDG